MILALGEVCKGYDPKEMGNLIDTHLSQATSLHHDQQAEYEVRILQANKLEKRSDPLEKRRETLQK